MQTRKIILNDGGEPMTKIQARKEFNSFVTKAVLESYEGGVNPAQVHLDATVDDEGEITLRNLLELGYR